PSRSSPSRWRRRRRRNGGDPPGYQLGFGECGTGVGYVALFNGVMNEAELHVLKQRMYQGKLNKARRGELLGTPPIGYVRLATGEWVIDPDEQVQAVVRLIFDQFDREATLHGLLRYLVHHQVRIPVRPAGGPNKGQLEWRGPEPGTLHKPLRHPQHRRGE